MTIKIAGRSEAVVKPQFRVRIGKPKDETIPAPWSLWSPYFRLLVGDALTAYQDAEARSQPGAAKLTRDAFLRETLKIQPSASLASVQALKRKLDSGDLNLSFSRSAMRKMIRELRGPNLRTPPTAQRWDERSKALFLQPRVDLVLAELARVNSTPLELFGAAILSTPEDAFGTATGAQADLDFQLKNVCGKRDELCKLVGVTWTSNDVDAGTYNGGRTTAAKFRGTPVDVAPVSNCGVRLVQYLASGVKFAQFIRAQQKSQVKSK